MWDLIIFLIIETYSICHFTPFENSITLNDTHKNNSTSQPDILKNNSIPLISNTIKSTNKCMQFSDKELERYALDVWDKDHNGCLTKEETDKVLQFPAHWLSEEYIDNICDKYGIQSLNDLEQFPKLDTLCGPNCKSLREVSLSNIKSVCEQAFLGATNLSKVNLPNVIKIGDLAFYNCKGLTRINLPKAEHIGAFSFGACSNLEELILPNAWHIPNNLYDYKFRGGQLKGALDCHGMPRDESCMREIKEKEFLYEHYYITDSPNLQKLVLASPYPMGCRFASSDTIDDCTHLITAIDSKTSRKVNLTLHENQRSNVGYDRNTPIKWSDSLWKSIQFTDGTNLPRQ